MTFSRIVALLIAAIFLVDEWITLQQLTKLPNSVSRLQYYRFGSTGAITAEGQAALAALPLQFLRLEAASPAANRGFFELLAKSESLHTLRIDFPISSDQLAELEPLAKSKSLRQLELYNKVISDADADRLAKLLPACRINLQGKVITPAISKLSPNHDVAVNLLPLLEPAILARTGAWEMSQGQLLGGPITPNSSLELPVQVAAAYRLEIDIERVIGNDAFTVAFPIGNGMGRILFQKPGAPKPWSGLDVVDGVKYDGRAEVYREPVFGGKKFVSIVLDVTAGGVHASADGVQIVDWKGEGSQLSMSSNLLLASGSLTLNNGDAVFRISKLTYTALAIPAAEDKPEKASPMADKSP